MRNPLVAAGIASLSCVFLAAHSPAGRAQGYDPRWNPNYRPPPAQVNPNATSDQLWEQAQPYPVQRKFRQALPLIQRAAQMGNVHAEAEMGILYQSTDIGLEDDRQAVYWFSLAAKQGHRGAEYELGAMYEDGEGGLPRDPRRAIQLYQQSAAQGFPQAMMILGVDYELGDGVPRSRSTAIQYLRKGGGEGEFVAQALSSPQCPPRFANAMQLGNYLARLKNAQFAQSWNKAVAPYSHPSHMPTVGGMLYEKWLGAGGSNNGYVPIH